MLVATIPAVKNNRSQSWSFFRDHPTGGILSRIISDVAQIQRLGAKVLADIVRVSAQMPFILALCLWTSWQLTVFALP